MAIGSGVAVGGVGVAAAAVEVDGTGAATAADEVEGTGSGEAGAAATSVVEDAVASEAAVVGSSSTSFFIRIMKFRLAHWSV